MKRLISIVVLGLLIGCSGESTNEPEDNETVDSTIVVVESDLEKLNTEQMNSLVVNLFLSLTKEVIDDDDYCFNYEEIEGLCKGDEPVLDGWDIPIVVQEHNFLTIFNQLCSSMIDFKIIDFNNKKYAFLTETSKNAHVYRLFNYDSGSSAWTDETELLPKVNGQDFFLELTKDEEKLVAEYGVYFLYLDENGVYFSFSDWRMSENLLNDKGVEFFHEADHELKLNWKGNQFSIENMTWD